MSVSTIKCHTPDCHNIKRVRGVCASCYNKYRIKVNTGTTTWDTLVKEGACLAAVSKHPWKTGSQHVDPPIKRRNN